MDVAACVFDAYGTLLDLTSAIAPHERRLGDAGPRLLALWRARQLEYTWLRTAMGRHADFDTVAREALTYALEALGISSPGLDEALLEAFTNLGAQPGAVALLERLRARGLRTAVLSNGTPATLASALSHSGLAPLMDAVMSVEAVGKFKPAPEVYAYGARTLGVVPERLLFVSQHEWDIAGAASAGYRTVLVRRNPGPAERLPAGPEHVVGSLAEIAELAGA